MTSEKKPSKKLDIYMDNADLDTALTLIDYGKFHYNVMASCAFCLLSSGIQNGLPAFVIPAAHCELNLTSFQMGFINASFLVGGVCSSFLWGIVGDLNGRRKVLIITLFLDSLVTFFCAFMQNFIGIMCCRFINGFLIGAPGSLTFTYLAEFHSPRHRSKSIYYSGVFYTLSWLILPAVAWIVLPMEIDIRLGDFVVFSPWRIFLLSLILPELIAGVWLLHLPESPKFLAMNEPKKALRVLRKMYSVNTGKSKREFPLRNLTTQANNRDSSKNVVNCRGKVARIIEDVCWQMNSLFKVPLLMMTLLLSGIMFSNMFGYFGLGLWLPELLTEREEERLNFTTQNNWTVKDVKPCILKFDKNLYERTMIIGIVAVFGNVISGYLSGKFKQNIIPLFTLLIGGLSTTIIYWLKTSWQYLIIACIFQSTMSIANIAIGSVIVELFPTSVNAVAICTAMFFGRIGAILSNIIFGYLVDAYWEVAVFVVAAVLLIGAALCFLIPNLNQNENSKFRNSQQNTIEISVISV